ncbi:MAG: T9SS type A sorting domain-containing protein [Bacteroidetes bacterium]|nr:T9SS type A sorting domain-containing protein [Bacteroidota bacterium]
MNRSVTMVAAALLVLTGSLLGDVFASRIRVTNPDGSAFDGKFNDGTGMKVTYILNDTATIVEVKVYNAATNALAATLSASNQGRGEHSQTWDGTGSAGGQKYYVRIQTTQPVRSNDAYKAYYFQNTADVAPISRGIFTRGVDVNNNMDSKGFGYWYASASDPSSNDGYKTGTLRYNPDGSFAGSEAGHPMLTNTLGTGNGGTFNWGSTAPWTTALDAAGRVYQVSNGGNFITRLDHDTAAPKIIIRNVTAPRGVYAVGSGANLKLYIAADTVVWRANIGTSDTLTTPLELVASLGTYVRDVIIDDAGYMLVTLRTGTTGTVPGYIERYDISGTLPKKRIDAAFSLSHSTGQPVCFALNHGPDRNSASDDTIYYSIRGTNGSDTNNIGIHQIVNAESAFPEAKRIFKSGDVPGSLGGNNNANADIALDWAGNLIWFENSNEEIFMVAPPRAGSSVTRVTKGYDTVTVSGATSVGSGGLTPDAFALHQNFPNPFNPSTQIAYTLPANGTVTVEVYDILGNRIAELYSGSASQGYHAVQWNAAGAASGMYLYRVTAQLNDGRSFTDAKRMLLLK